MQTLSIVSILSQISFRVDSKLNFQNAISPKNKVNFSQLLIGNSSVENSIINEPITQRPTADLNSLIVQFPEKLKSKSQQNSNNSFQTPSPANNKSRDKKVNFPKKKITFSNRQSSSREKEINHLENNQPLNLFKSEQEIDNKQKNSVNLLQEENLLESTKLIQQTKPNVNLFKKEAPNCQPLRKSPPKMPNKKALLETTLKVSHCSKQSKQFEEPKENTQNIDENIVRQYKKLLQVLASLRSRKKVLSSIFRSFKLLEVPIKFKRPQEQSKELRESLEISSRLTKCDLQTNSKSLADILSLIEILEFDKRLYFWSLDWQIQNFVPNLPMSFFGVEINFQINRLLFEIRLHLSKNRYMPNARNIYRSFAEWDRECSGLIDPFAFEKALNQNGIFMKKYDIQVFERAYGENGQINWFNFLHQLKEPMGPNRRELVQNIFDSIDSEHTGKIEVEKLMSHFNYNEIDTFRFGRKDEQQIYNEFTSQFHIQDGYVSKEEFMAFYDDLNINFAHNEGFFRYVSQQWFYTPEKQQEVSLEEVKKVLSALKAKLLERTQGSKDQLLVTKLFNEFDTNKSSAMGSYDLDLMLKKFDLNVPARLVEPVLHRIDKNQSGYIEFEEFKKFLYYSVHDF